MDENIRENKRQKKGTEKNTTARKDFLQPKRSGYFKKYQDSIYSLSSSPSKERIKIFLIPLLYTTLKDAFVHLRGKMGNLPNQRRPKLAMGTIQIVNMQF